VADLTALHKAKEEKQKQQQAERKTTSVRQAPRPGKSQKPKASSPAKPRRATYNLTQADEDELARLSRVFLDAGIAPQRIEESKVVRAVLRLAFQKDVTPEQIAATYEELMAADRRRTRS